MLRCDASANMGVYFETVGARRAVPLPPFHASLCPQGMGVYMKELTVSSSSSFMLCCVRWLDMAVIGDRTAVHQIHHTVEKKTGYA